MSAGPVLVPRETYDELLREIRRITDIDLPRLAGEIEKLRSRMIAVRDGLRQYAPAPAPSPALKTMADEPTPVRPPSRTDIQAAFENSVDFATGRRKPDQP